MFFSLFFLDVSYPRHLLQFHPSQCPNVASLENYYILYFHFYFLVGSLFTSILLLLKFGNLIWIHHLRKSISTYGFITDIFSIFSIAIYITSAIELLSNLETSDEFQSTIINFEIQVQYNCDCKKYGTV